MSSPLLDTVGLMPLPEIACRQPLERIFAGRNSRVYKAQPDNGRPMAIKQYFRQDAQGRDRLGVEYASLSYLRQQGICNVPRPLAVDAAAGWAAYEWIDGCPISSMQATVGDIDQVVEFLGCLKRIAAVTSEHRFGPASEACFSLMSLLTNIERRIDNLLEIPDSTSCERDMHRFMRSRLIPFYKQLIGLNANSDQTIDAVLGREHRTLSSSDFGFHNALREKSGTICFLDFEYFGWDDPAKTMADFCLHPAMLLSADLCAYFIDRSLALYKNDRQLPARFLRVYPFFGIKWCLILLNEFLPADLARRHFAKGSLQDRYAVQRRQLAKTATMLQRIKNEYKHGCVTLS